MVATPTRKILYESSVERMKRAMSKVDGGKKRKQEPSGRVEDERSKEGETEGRSHFVETFRRYRDGRYREPRIKRFSEYGISVANFRR